MMWRTLVPTRFAYAMAARMEINAELVQLEDFMRTRAHRARRLAAFLDMWRTRAGQRARSSPHHRLRRLIVAGERDHMTPRELSEEMRKQIPGAELLVVEGGSHTAPIERPHFVNDAISRFLAPIRPRGGEIIPASRTA